MAKKVIMWEDDLIWKEYPKNGTTFEAWIEALDGDAAHVIMTCEEEDNWRCSHHYTDTTYKIIHDFDNKFEFKTLNSYIQIFKTEQDFYRYKRIHLLNDLDDLSKSIEKIDKELRRIEEKLNESTSTK